MRIEIFSAPVSKVWCFGRDALLEILIKAKSHFPGNLIINYAAKAG